MATLADYWAPGETTNSRLAGLVPAICISYVVSFILLGAYVCLFGTTLWVMKQRTGIRGPTVPLVVGIFVLCTTNTLADLYVFCRGFGTYPDGAVMYWHRFVLGQIDRWSVILVDLTFDISTVLADGLLIWRAYVVWGRKARVIWFPAFFLVLATGAGLMLPVVAGLEAYRGFTFTSLIQAGVATGVFYGSSWIVTWYGTIAIAVRLYSVGMGTIGLYDSGQGGGGGRKKHPYRKIILVVLESGFILSMSVFAISIFYVIAQAQPEYTLQTITAAVVLPPIHRKIVGIVPTLMLLQLNIGRASNSDTTTHKPSSETMTMRFAPRPSQTHNATSRTGMQFSSAEHTKDTIRGFELDDLSDSFVLARSSATRMTGSISDKEEV